MTKPKSLEKAEKHFAKQRPERTQEAGWPDKHLEKDVKKFVKEIILEMDPDADIFCPVQTGFGRVDLDFVVGIIGFYLSIETKVSGKKPTHRQLQTIKHKTDAGIPTLIIDQDNLYDLAFAVDLLRQGKQRSAWGYANTSRAAYLAR